MARPFAAPGTPIQYLPDRPVVVQHVRLELDLDLELPGEYRERAFRNIAVSECNWK